MRRYLCDLEFENEDVVRVYELEGRPVRVAGRTMFEVGAEIFRLVDLSETPEEALRVAIARRREYAAHLRAVIERTKATAHRDEVLADLAEHAEVGITRYR